MQHLEVSGVVRHIYVIRRLKVGLIFQNFNQKKAHNCHLIKKCIFFNIKLQHVSDRNDTSVGITLTGFV